jgi:ribosome-associated translation inhibitor RaiA
MLFLRRVLSDRAFDAMFRTIERQMSKSKARFKPVSRSQTN